MFRVKYLVSSIRAKKIILSPERLSKRHVSHFAFFNRRLQKHRGHKVRNSGSFRTQICAWGYDARGKSCNTTHKSPPRIRGRERERTLVLSCKYRGAIKTFRVLNRNLFRLQRASVSSRKSSVRYTTLERSLAVDSNFRGYIRRICEDLDNSRRKYSAQQPFLSRCCTNSRGPPFSLLKSSNLVESFRGFR